LNEAIKIVHDLEEAELLSTIQDAKAVIVPSLSEGFGFSAVKSMAIGCPLIASTNGALTEVINGKHIWIKPHSADGLAKAIRLSESDIWQNKASQNFDFNASVRKFHLTYSKLVKG